MQCMRVDLADKVANGSIAQPPLVKVNQKPPKSQAKTKSSIFTKAISFGRSKSDEGLNKL
jgi:hypothetical protein